MNNVLLEVSFIARSYFFLLKVIFPFETLLHTPIQNSVLLEDVFYVCMSFTDHLVIILCRRNSNKHYRSLFFNQIPYCESGTQPLPSHSLMSRINA